MEFVAA
jgi:hypothetical protein